MEKIGRIHGDREPFVGSAPPAARSLSQAPGTVAGMVRRGPGGGPVRILLGGGIGAGKTSVCDVFAAHGFEVIVADAVGHSVLQPGGTAVDAVAEAWPTAVHDGIVDRARLARIVFTDPDELARLEAITHPEIGARIEDMLDDAPGPVVVEVPVMSVLADREFVRVAVVADEDLRLARAVARGGDEADVRRRMASQPSDAEWRAWADVVVDNSGPWADTEQAVVDVISGLVPA